MAGAQASRVGSAALPGRKAEHLRINLEEDVAAKGVTTGFERYRFVPAALPEIDLAQVDTSTVVFGRRLAAPLLISCMTGGVPEAERINRTLAQAAQELGLAIGLGSGRVLLEHPEVLPTFRVRPDAPDALIFANLGAVQLNLGVAPDHCRWLVEQLEADALVLHLNALQEALQPEGDTAFAGLLDRIAALCAALEVPVIVKEVGWGIPPDTVARLFAAGVAAVDVAGAGGTSWSEVERHRMDSEVRRRVAAAFVDWGIPTAEALLGARQVAPDRLIFASGGIRGGMDVAKALALGADLVGMAGPFLRAAAQGAAAVRDLAAELIETLRITMFCLGAPTLGHLRGTPRLVPTDPAALRIVTEDLVFRTDGPGAFIDITGAVAGVVEHAGLRDGSVQIYSHHTTAAIRINEHEPLLLDDFQHLLERLAPGDGAYAHDDLARRDGVGPEEPRNGHAHCRHLLLGSSESVPLAGGQLRLGPWQRVFLIELDAARERRVTVQVVGR
ncbi:MAG: type 2 isopentenyl-diphosphate Delta-isomerase [Sphaerobacter sp.]|nr:type 2 isopentenyl-diphosphate Delta-isomerase [Sphaerobacter sp.]